MTAKRYQLIVFDWEGTLSDSLGQAYDVTCAEVEKRGMIRPQEGQFQEAIQYGPQLALKKLYPDLSEEQMFDLLMAVQQGFAKPSEQVYLLPGAMALLQALYENGYDLAVASNKSEPSLAKAIKASGLDAYITAFRCPGMALPKPDVDMLQQLIDFFQVSADQCLVIGDSEIDIEMARQMNVTAVGLDFYHQNQTCLEKAGAAIVVDNFTDVASFIGI